MAAHKTKASHTCPECLASFAGDVTAVFCTPAHKQAFHNRAMKRGKVLVPMLLAWRAAKSKRKDPVGAWAFGEICWMADMWNAEDRAAGRMAAGTYLLPKHRSGWSAVDLAA